MEVIVFTPNLKYSNLIHSNKIIHSANVELIELIETEVFLNHHFNINLFLLKDNFPYQLHCPLEISKHLLNRNKGAVQLTINDNLHFRIQEDSDTLDILSNAQNCFKGVQNDDNVSFRLKFWQVEIRIDIVKEVGQQRRIKQAVCKMVDKRDKNEEKEHVINKVVVYIDDSNFENFLSWAQDEGDKFNDGKINEECLQIRQQIQNEKSAFKNKIKIVETILGENVNIQKLLTEEKQENQEFKRIRQTIKTIKNIDNVLIDQDKKLDTLTKQLKQRIIQKHSKKYQYAQNFTRYQNQIIHLKKQIQQLRYNFKKISVNKEKINYSRHFQPSDTVNTHLETTLGILKSTLQQKNNPSVQNFTNKLSDNRRGENRYLSHSNFIKTQKRKISQYHCVLKQRANIRIEDLQQQSLRNYEKSVNEMKVYEDLLKQVAQNYEKNQKFLQTLHAKNRDWKKVNLHIKTCYTGNIDQMDTKLNYTKKYKQLWSNSEFIVLNELIQWKNEDRMLTQDLKKQNQSEVSSRFHLTDDDFVHQNPLNLGNEYLKINFRSNQLGKQLKKTGLLTKNKINFSFDKKAKDLLKIKHN